MSKAKKGTIEALSREISGLRRNLDHTALENGLTSSKVLALSQRLDALLVRYIYLAEGNNLTENVPRTLREKSYAHMK